MTISMGYDMSVSPFYFSSSKREILMYKLDQDGIPISLVLVIGGCEVLRIDEKSIYYRGNLIMTDEEVGSALREWLDLMSIQRVMDS